MENPARELRSRPPQWGACGEPVPSMPSMIGLIDDDELGEDEVTLGPGGIIAWNMLRGCEREPCAECGGYGGGAARSVDPETGAPQGILILLGPGDGGDADGWLARMMGRSFGEPRDSWVRALRAQRVSA